MHVVWAPSWYPTKDDPLNGSFFAEQVQMLREGGLEVGVIALDPHSFWQGKPGPVQHDGRVVRRSVPVLPKGVFPGDQALTDFYARPLAKAYEAEFGRPDLLHAHSVFPGLLLARSLARYWDVPFGMTEHRPSSLERDPRSPRFRTIREAVAGASFRFTVSDGMANRATRVYGAKFETLPLPVSDAFARVEPDVREDSAFVFAHLSMLDRNKRPEETVQAFAALHQRQPNTRLIIGGGSAQRVAQVKAVADQLGVGQSVQLLGQVSRSDVPKFMANADCHVLFSATEAGGVVFSEAHATGTPSIASATDGGVFQVRPEFGMLVPVDDVEALTAAMGQMMEAKAKGAYARAAVRAEAVKRVGVGPFVERSLRNYRRAIF